MGVECWSVVGFADELAGLVLKNVNKDLVRCWHCYERMEVDGCFETYAVSSLRTCARLGCVEFTLLRQGACGLFVD